MTRFEIVEQSIALALDFGESCNSNLWDWLKDVWHLGLFVTAILLGLKADLEITDSMIGPLFTGWGCYSGTSQTIEIQCFGHPWLPLYVESVQEVL
jgi:hypothetical protein